MALLPLEDKATPFVLDCGIVRIIMGKVTGIKGMRHIALKVTDVKRSKAFYQENFGMEVVWEPDPENVYLSSGIDNLALHAAPNVPEAAPKNSQRLDHLGFLVDSIARVQELEKEFRDRGIGIVHPFKLHRDGSASFYCADPDGIVIQMLYEPTLSRQKID
jgi:catechol 2,3-dioxygenase-like lactoylglutathione lyase family enzyme